MRVQSRIELTLDDIRPLIAKFQEVADAAAGTFSCYVLVDECKSEIQKLCDDAFDAGYQLGSKVGSEER